MSANKLAYSIKRLIDLNAALLKTAKRHKLEDLLESVKKLMESE